MSLYHKIIVAVDPFIDSENIVSKARKLLANDGVLDLVYVREEIPVVFAGAPLAPPLAYTSDTNEHKIQAQKMLRELAKKYAISEKNTHILTGSTSQEIRNFAKKTKVDCIVIGSHGRHGVALLLGSTATSVIHGTPCDILVVKI
jgi:universal stress protein A